MTENEIAKIIVDAAYHVHKKLGPGIFDVLTAIGKDRVVKRLGGVSELFGEA